MGHPAVLFGWMEIGGELSGVARCPLMTLRLS